MGGITYVEVNYDTAWVQNALANISGFSWYFEWGMYLFLIATLAILFWIFFDSITKKKDQKALVPRILAIVGFFAVIPSFIFRFVGTADGVVTLVRLNAEPGAPYYPGPIYYNVGMLVDGWGPAIAIIGILGLIISLVGLVIYASTVQRAKPSTEFVQAFDNRMASLENKVAAANSAPVTSSLSGAVASSAAAPAGAKAAKTIFDKPPHAATIIDTPKTDDMIVIEAGSGRGRSIALPANDIVIGRDFSNYIVIDDGKVSSNHAKLIYSNGVWIVTDLASTNGTFVNGGKIDSQTQLSNGDKIKVGDTILAFVSSR